MSRAHSAERAPSALLVLLFSLLLIDAGFILIHAAQSAWTPERTIVSLDKDRGIPELFQYGKLCWILFMLGTLRRRTKELVYTGWFALFGYVLLDDSLQLHERAEIEFGSNVNAETLLGLRVGTFGELLFFGVMALILFTVIAILRAGGSRSASNATRDLGLLFVIAVFAGVGVDLLHSLAEGQFEVGLILIEDGGEMLSMSIICWYVSWLHARGGCLPEALLWKSNRKTGLSVAPSPGDLGGTQ